VKRILRLIGFIALPFAAGALGSYFTYPNIEGWYSQLSKPAFSPPNWVFGPVWSLLYVLMGAASYRIFSKGLKNGEVKKGLVYYGIQLGLNSIWSIVFFGMKELGLAFVIMVALWIFIYLTIDKFMKIDRLAGMMLLPYIFWVSFAAFLNLSVYLLNR